MLTLHGRFATLPQPRPKQKQKLFPGHADPHLGARRQGSPASPKVHPAAQPPPPPPGVLRWRRPQMATTRPDRAPLTPRRRAANQRRRRHARLRRLSDETVGVHIVQRPSLVATCTGSMRGTFMERWRQVSVLGPSQAKSIARKRAGAVRCPTRPYSPALCSSTCP
jgi:hypothetical protein